MRFLLTILSKLKKKITPSLIRNYKRKKRDEKIKEEFSGLSNKEVFEKIYDENRWGNFDQQKRKYSSGDGTRNTKIVGEYIDVVTDFLSKNPKLKTGLDLGCGDFSVGVHFCELFKNYTAADVAENVIKENRKIYRNSRVKFHCLDLTSEDIPKADVIFVRQALQHLSNSEIMKFVKNVRGKFKFLIVTESLSKSPLFVENKDIITGPGIRIHKKSGVVLEKKPFDLEHSDMEVVLETSAGRELFVTKVYSA